MAAEGPERRPLRTAYQAVLLLARPATSNTGFKETELFDGCLRDPVTVAMIVFLL